jgi:hypothetical protein
MIMPRYFKMLAMALAFVVIATLGASTAQASSGVRLSSTTIGASGRLTMNGILVCEVLLQLTASSLTLLKNAAPVQARASRGYIRNCTGSLAGTPPTGDILNVIDLKYRGFTGTLPNISRINVIAPITTGSPNGAQFSVNTIANVCLYQGALDGIGFDLSGGRITGVDFDATNPLPKASGSILCPSTGTIRGDLTTFLPSAPTVTLI